jgi:hypothetical protein
MTSNLSTETQRQHPTDTADAIAPTVAANREAADLDFAAALDALREGIDGYGDRISASAAVLRAVDDLSVPTDLLSHPKIEQSIWRYEHGAETVRGEIERTIDRYHEDNEEPVAGSDVVAAFRVAAARLDIPISTE